MTNTDKIKAHLHLIRCFADETHERNYGDKKLYIKQQADRIEALLSASPAGVVKPKPLEWEWYEGDGMSCWIASGLGRTYQAGTYVDGNAYWGLFRVIGSMQDADNLEAAKSAAFADYSARIMSVIEPAGVGVETATCVIKDAFEDAGVEVGGTFARELALKVSAALKGGEQ